MISEKFFQSKTAIVTLIAACFVVLISLGVRQTFGLFFMDFNESLKISNTAFGFAIGMQMLMWGITGPIFGAIADKYGCLLYTSPSPRDFEASRMPSSA